MAPDLRQPGFDPEERLLEYLYDELSPEERAAFLAFVKQHPEWEERLQQLTVLKSRLDEVETPLPPPEAVADILEHASRARRLAPREEKAGFSLDTLLGWLLKPQFGLGLAAMLVVAVGVYMLQEVTRPVDPGSPQQIEKELRTLTPEAEEKKAGGEEEAGGRRPEAGGEDEPATEETAAEPAAKPAPVVTDEAPEEPAPVQMNGALESNPEAGKDSEERASAASRDIPIRGGLAGEGAEEQAEDAARTVEESKAEKLKDGRTRAVEATRTEAANRKVLPEERESEKKEAARRSNEKEAKEVTVQGLLRKGPKLDEAVDKSVDQVQERYRKDSRKARAKREEKRKKAEAGPAPEMFRQSDRANQDDANQAAAGLDDALRGQAVQEKTVETTSVEAEEARPEREEPAPAVDRNKLTTKQAAEEPAKAPDKPAFQLAAPQEAPAPTSSVGSIRSSTGDGVWRPVEDAEGAGGSALDFGGDADSGDLQKAAKIAPNAPAKEPADQQPAKAEGEAAKASAEEAVPAGAKKKAQAADEAVQMEEDSAAGACAQIWNEILALQGAGRFSQALNLLQQYRTGPCAAHHDVASLSLKEAELLIAHGDKARARKILKKARQIPAAERRAVEMLDMLE